MSTQDINDMLLEDETSSQFDDDEKEKYLTFYVDNQLFAIPSSQVVDIMSLPKITYMPKLPEFVKGVINIRGKVVPLLELQHRLKGVPAVYDDSTCIIVIDHSEMNVGFIVDRVHDVSDIAYSQISKPPIIKTEKRQFLSGIAKLPNGVAMILDCEKILSDENKKATTENVIKED
ncbi:MAG: chemotaxis protein CheW [Oscillospiraceae bacterium]